MDKKITEDEQVQCFLWMVRKIKKLCPKLWKCALTHVKAFFIYIVILKNNSRCQSKQWTLMEICSDFCKSWIGMINKQKDLDIDNGTQLDVSD